MPVDSSFSAEPSSTGSSVAELAASASQFDGALNKLYAAFKADEQPPKDCYEPFKLPRQEWQRRREEILQRDDDFSKFFLTLRYEYDPMIEIFQFKDSPSVLHATLCFNCILIILKWFDQYRKDNPTHTQYLPPLIASTDSSILFLNHEGVSGTKLPDMMLRCSTYTLGTPVCIAAIAFAQDRKDAGDKVTKLILYWMGKINIGFVVSVEYFKPPEDDSSEGMDESPAIHFDIYRAEPYLENGVTKLRVIPTRKTIRFANGSIPRGNITFAMSDFYPTLDFGAGEGENKLPNDKSIHFPRKTFLKEVVQVAIDCHYAKFKDDKKHISDAKKAKENNLPREVTVLKPSTKRKFAEPEEGGGRGGREALTPSSSIGQSPTQTQAVLCEFTSLRVCHLSTG